MTTTFGVKDNLTTTNNQPCAVCGKQKFQLKVRKSKLTGNPMLVCVPCFEGKYEPRWAIILVGLQDGLDSVDEFLVNHRYVGAEIPAIEFIKK